MKEPDAFPWGADTPNRDARYRHGRSEPPKVRRRSAVCSDCWRREDEARQARQVEWDEDGVRVRRCASCEDVKPLLENFYPTGTKKDGSTKYYSYCKPCQHERTGAYLREQMRDPERAEQIRRRRRENSKRQRQRDPEGYRRKQRESERRAAADPERHARRLEARRIAYRLKREREGVPLEDGWRVDAARPAELHGAATLPAAPLARMIEAYIARGQADGAAGHRGQDGVPSADDLCAEMGVSQRQLYRWTVEGGEGVTFTVADRVLTLAEILWFDVWFCGAHAEREPGCADCEGRALAGIAFEGEACPAAA